MVDRLMNFDYNFGGSKVKNSLEGGFGRHEVHWNCEES